MDNSTTQFVDCADNYMLQCTLKGQELTLKLYLTDPEYKITEEIYVFETLPNPLGVFFQTMKEVFQELAQERYSVNTNKGVIQLHLENNVNGRLVKSNVILPLYKQTYLEKQKIQEVQLKIAKEQIRKEKKKRQEQEFVIKKLSQQVQDLRHQKAQEQNKWKSNEDVLRAMSTEIQTLKNLINQVIKQEPIKISPPQDHTRTFEEIFAAVQAVKKHSEKKITHQAQICNKKLNEQIKTLKNDYEGKLCFWKSFMVSSTVSLFDIGLQNHHISYKGEKEWTQLLHSTGFKKQRSSTIKILKITNNSFGFGVIDSTYREQRHTSSGEYPNRVLNISNQIMEAGKTVKHPDRKFKEGDIVNMKVSNGHIEWRINQQLQAEYVCDRLKDTNIDWVPYIIMYHSGDTIQWIE